MKYDPYRERQHPKQCLRCPFSIDPTSYDVNCVAGMVESKYKNKSPEWKAGFIQGWKERAERTLDLEMKWRRRKNCTRK